MGQAKYRGSAQFVRIDLQISEFNASFTSTKSPGCDDRYLNEFGSDERSNGQEHTFENFPTSTKSQDTGHIKNTIDRLSINQIFIHLTYFIAMTRNF